MSKKLFFIICLIISLFFISHRAKQYETELNNTGHNQTKQVKKSTLKKSLDKVRNRD